VEQLAGRTATDPGWDFLLQDGSPMPFEQYPVNRVLASGEALEGLVVGVRRAAGEEPVWLLCNAYPIRDADDRLGQIVVTFIDITAMIHAEREVRASERKFRETVESLDEGYYSVTLDGVLLDHNPAYGRVLGIDGDDDLRGQHTPDFWTDPADRHAYVQRLRAEDHVRDYLVEAKRADGSRLYVLLNAHVVRDEHGEIERIEGTVLDFTARRAAEDEVERLNAELEQRVVERTAELDAANKELEAFAYSVSHDLRAPLRHISGFSTLLADRTSEGLDEKSRHYVDVINKSVNEMGVLIDDLLQFSRTGRAALTIEPVDMDVVVQEALAPLLGEMDGRDVRWSIAPLPAAEADRALIRQVWVNLLGNALKYTRQSAPAHIDVSGALMDGEVVYSVADNGVGFDMQYAHKLFGVFQRLHDASEFEGTGIGLANVHRIVTRLHGRVWAEGAPGNGATFSFSLPAAMETM
jgi:PAS domain S-box-containing protein